jgi:protein gp37
MASTNTEISWTDKTWNPVRGCTRVSDGCRHCYAERVAYRFSGPGKPYEGLAKKVGNEARWTGKVKLVHEALEEPFSWRKPSRIFVNSMSDLFHEEVPFEFIDEVFWTMATADWHTYQVLTKRPARMKEYFDRIKNLFELQHGKIWLGTNNQMAAIHQSAWPLHNVWLGVSVENQAAADERIPLLLQAPAAIRFLSCEPLLGPLSLWSTPMGTEPFVVRNWLEYNQRVHDDKFNPVTYNRIDWVIVGGESGPGARPMHPDWPKTLRDQCTAVKVPFHFKQWGAWVAKALHPDYPPQSDFGTLTRSGEWFPTATTWNGRQGEAEDDYEYTMRNVGKKVAGRELDGREWNEFPEVKELTTAAQ